MTCVSAIGAFALITRRAISCPGSLKHSAVEKKTAQDALVLQISAWARGLVTLYSWNGDVTTTPG